MVDPHGSYLTLGRARWLSWLDLRQSRTLSISEKVVKKCHFLLYFLNFLCMLVEDMFAYKLRALDAKRRGSELSKQFPSSPHPKIITLPSHLVPKTFSSRSGGRFLAQPTPPTCPTTL